MTVHWLGYVGTALVIVAYLPQVTHLIRERCSAGLSFWAYILWASAAALLLSYALSVRDPVFIALQVYQMAATVTICVLSKRYQGSLCDEHGGPTGRAVRAQGRTS